MRKERRENERSEDEEREKRDLDDEKLEKGKKEDEGIDETEEMYKDGLCMKTKETRC